MAITKTRKIENIKVLPAEDQSLEADALTNRANPTVTVTYINMWDDPNDDDLPVVSPSAHVIFRYQDDGSDADYSSHEELVRSICLAAWS